MSDSVFCELFTYCIILSVDLKSYKINAYKGKKLIFTVLLGSLNVCIFYLMSHSVKH